MEYRYAVTTRNIAWEEKEEFHRNFAPRRLTLQEQRLLALLIEGHYKKTAADVMGISVNTVSFHLKNIYDKLQVHSKTEAVVKVLREGLLPSAQEPAPESRPYNQARANFHSRSIVARESPRVAAISSVERPPKNFSSTM